FLHTLGRLLPASIESRIEMHSKSPCSEMMNAEKIASPCMRMAHCQQNTLPRYRCFIVVASP
ncbi:hypothetical protein AAA627_22005, partial [Pseudomonas aeruginosa]